jgi:hypothetical protein
LTGSDTSRSDGFGRSVALYETTALVGATGDWAIEDDSSTQQAGSAYIFEQNPLGGWVETAHLTATNPQPFHVFGWSASIWGSTAVVSAIGEDDTATDSGAVYIFEKDAGGNWPQSARLTDGSTEDFRRFGNSLVIYESTLLIGNSRDRPIAVYQKDTLGQWIKTADIADPPGNGVGSHGFGASLSLQAGRALIGAPDADTGQNLDRGVAFIYEEIAPGNWSQEARLTASDAASFDDFGRSVSRSGAIRPSLARRLTTSQVRIPARSMCSVRIRPVCGINSPN